MDRLLESLDIELSFVFPLLVNFLGGLIFFGVSSTPGNTMVSGLVLRSFFLPLASSVLAVLGSFEELFLADLYVAMDFDMSEPRPERFVVSSTRDTTEDEELRTGFPLEPFFPIDVIVTGRSTLGLDVDEEGDGEYRLAEGTGDGVVDLLCLSDDAEAFRSSLPFDDMATVTFNDFSSPFFGFLAEE